MIRLAIVAVCFVALSGAIVGRMVYVNINDRDFLQEQGDLRTIRLERINAHRGMIRDRLGKPLAISSPVVSLWANPNELLSSSSDLNQLATMLKVDPEEFADRLDQWEQRQFGRHVRQFRISESHDGRCTAICWIRLQILCWCWWA